MTGHEQGPTLICKNKKSQLQIVWGVLRAFVTTGGTQIHRVEFAKQSAVSSCSLSNLSFHPFCEFSVSPIHRKIPHTPISSMRGWSVTQPGSTGKWPQHQTCQELALGDTWLSFRWFCKEQAAGLHGPYESNPAWDSLRFSHTLN